MKKQIVNIVNFVRACEPRFEMDLIEPVKQQIKIMTERKLKGTFLLQYDAMCDESFISLFKEIKGSQFEFGIWYEIVEPLVKKCGIEWRGRYPWDWHVHCGFSLGYNNEQRKLLIDECFEKFKSIFGYYPKVIGSWLFDTYTVNYTTEKYYIDAMCICRDQYGTDGYTLWGGYYGQGYYPSKNNFFVPASNKEAQINVPIFRMLGPDPVYQYDFGMDTQSGAEHCQGVITLEPACAGGGGNKEWIDWFYRENFNGNCLSFGYAQTGQENSFPWDTMKDGLEYQFALLEKLSKKEKIIVQKLSDTGREYKKAYKETPPSAIAPRNAYDDENKNSVWYCSKNYRINLYADEKGTRIRDLHVFSDEITDNYVDNPCKTNEAVYETLPLVDGNRFTGNGIISGVYFTDESGKEIKGKLDFSERENDSSSALVTCGELQIFIKENGIEFKYPKEFEMKNRIGIERVEKDSILPRIVSLDNNHICLSYLDTEYRVKILKGSLQDSRTIASCDGSVEVEFEV